MFSRVLVNPMVLPVTPAGDRQVACAGRDTDARSGIGDAVDSQRSCIGERQPAGVAVAVLPGHRQRSEAGTERSDSPVGVQYAVGGR